MNVLSLIYWMKASIELTSFTDLVDEKWEANLHLIKFPYTINIDFIAWSYLEVLENFWVDLPSTSGSSKLNLYVNNLLLAFVSIHHPIRSLACLNMFIDVCWSRNVHKRFNISSWWGKTFFLNYKFIIFLWKFLLKYKCVWKIIREAFCWCSIILTTSYKTNNQQMFWQFSQLLIYEDKWFHSSRNFRGYLSRSL